MESYTSEAMKKGLWRLVAPMLGEWLVLLSIPFVGIFFLSRASNEAAAAVSLVTPILVGCYVIIEAICMGGAGVAGRSMGAGRLLDCKNYLATTLLLVSVCTIIIALLLLFFSAPIVSLMGLTGLILENAVVYLKISSMMFIGWGVSAAYKIIINVYGFPKWNFYSTICMAIVNILLNIIILQFSEISVVTVAYCSLASSFVSVVFLLLVVKFKLRIDLHDIRVISNFKQLSKPIFLIALPAMIEPISFQFSAIIINKLISTLSIDQITVRIYANTVFSMCLVISISFAIATQTLVTQYIGATQFDTANKQLKQSLRAALMLTVAVCLIYLFFSDGILLFFAKDNTLLQIGKMVFALYAITELFRATNIIVTSSLKAAGDVWYISTIAIVITWLAAIPFAFAASYYFQWGILGLLSVVLFDEGLRAVINLSRWSKRYWQSSSLVNFST